MAEVILKIRDCFGIKGSGLIVIPELPVRQVHEFVPFNAEVVLKDPLQAQISFHAHFHLRHFSLMSENGEVEGETRIVLLLPDVSRNDVLGDEVILDEKTWTTLQKEMLK
jgi:hypothetical protein